MRHVVSGHVACATAAPRTRTTSAGRRLDRDHVRQSPSSLSGPYETGSDCSRFFRNATELARRTHPRARPCPAPAASCPGTLGVVAV
jgi:hypothetical protein